MSRSRLRVGLIPVLAAAAGCRGGAPIATESAADEYRRLVRGLQEEVRSAATRENPAASSSVRRLHFARFAEFAARHPGTREGLDALREVVWEHAALRDSKGLRRAFEDLCRDCPDQEKLVPFVHGLPILDEEKEPLLQRIVDSNGGAGTRAYAEILLAEWEWRAAGTDESRRLPARQRFENVMRLVPGSPLAARARRFLYEMDHLQLGMKAPDLSFSDVQGRPHRLSEYRGGVVLLVFAEGSREPPPAMGLLHEEIRVVQERVHPESVSVVWIALDSRPEDAEAGIREFGVSATIGFDGLGWFSPGVATYNLHGAPSVWLIAPDGTIAARDLAPHNLYERVEALLARVAASQPAAPAHGDR